MSIPPCSKYPATNIATACEVNPWDNALPIAIIITFQIISVLQCMYSVQTHEPSSTDIFFDVSYECEKVKAMVGSGVNVLPAEEDRSSNKRTPKVRRKYPLERSLSIAEEAYVDYAIGLIAGAFGCYVYIYMPA